MSCEAGANRIARWASQLGAGIAQLANKRAFYAGVGLGGAGLLGAGLIALARRQSARRQIAGRRNKKEQRSKESQEQVTMRPIPQLPTRTKIGPTSYLSSSDRCVGCQTPGTGKQGAWYSINGRTYCQDCAPEAARQANVDLVAPEREGAGSPARESAISLATARPSGERVRIPVRREGSVSSRLSYPTYLPPERRVETRLAQSRLRLNVGQDPNGRPAWFVVNNGHVILRPDGSDTGLAITPALKLGQVKEGLQEVEEDTGRWWLTHIPSGKTLGSQPYASLAEAQLLGSVLAQLDWTRPENEISDQEISQVSETMRRYNQALGEEQVEAKVKAEVKGPSLQSQPQPESLVGRLMTDNYGGVARVLDVTPDGETLLMIDSLGKRYEVGRAEVRLPQTADFEMCRVGMSFDPAKQPDAHCAHCRQAASNAEDGKWYRMGWKNFCSSCASDYAAEEGYLKDDEINSELEQVG